MLIPQPGDVLSYAYLWSHEAARGQEEGLKDRPVVVVLALQTASGLTQLVVLPITHSAPDHPADAIELPQIIKQALGLDKARSWIMLAELNRFVWPGPDIRPVGANGDPLYGALPDWFFSILQSAFAKRLAENKMRNTRRTQ